MDTGKLKTTSAFSRGEGSGPKLEPSRGDPMINSQADIIRVQKAAWFLPQPVSIVSRPPSVDGELFLTVAVHRDKLKSTARSNARLGLAIFATPSSERPSCYTSNDRSIIDLKSARQEADRSHNLIELPD